MKQEKVGWKYKLPFLLLVVIALLSLIPVTYANEIPEGVVIDHADTA